MGESHVSPLFWRGGGAQDLDARSSQQLTRTWTRPPPPAGKLCIEVNPSDKIAFISEELCIGCGICPKKCVSVWEQHLTTPLT